MSFVPYVPIQHDKRSDYFTQFIRFSPPYELPDGTLVHPCDELCTIPETVFFPYHPFLNINGDRNPELQALFPGTTRKRARSYMVKSSSVSRDAISSIAFNADKDSLTDLIYSSLLLSDVDVRKDLLANILLVGGGALIDGVAQRLTHELTDIVPSHIKVRRYLFLIISCFHMNSFVDVYIYVHIV